MTWLFFHDEAVAFAAGHRPCALCRRPAYNRFRDALSDDGARPGFDALDRRLHHERLITGTRERRHHESAWSELPDGAFVADAGGPALVAGRDLIAWRSSGYAERRRKPTRGIATVITPPATLRVLQSGYPIQIDATALTPQPAAGARRSTARSSAA